MLACSSSALLQLLLHSGIPPPSPFTPSSVVCIRVETPSPAAIALAASRTEPASPHAHCEKLSRPTFSATDFADAGIRCAFTGDLSGNSGSAKRRRCVFTPSFLLHTQFCYRLLCEVGRHVGHLPLPLAARLEGNGWHGCVSPGANCSAPTT